MWKVLLTVEHKDLDLGRVCVCVYVCVGVLFLYFNIHVRVLMSRWRRCSRAVKVSEGQCLLTQAEAQAAVRQSSGRESKGGEGRESQQN